jgi:hypothetical protein
LCIIRGSAAIAANFNAFTIANGDGQWMHRPGSDVPIADGYLDSVSKDLNDGYDAAEARGSKVREQVTELLLRKQGQDIHEAVDENGQMHAEIVSAEGHTESAMGGDCLSHST